MIGPEAAPRLVAAYSYETGCVTCFLMAPGREKDSEMSAVELTDDDLMLVRHLLTAIDYLLADGPQDPPCELEVSPETGAHIAALLGKIGRPLRGSANLVVSRIIPNYGKGNDP